MCFSQINIYGHKMKKLVKNIFFLFDLESKICGYFHHHIRNQRLKIRRYSKFQINWRYVLFGSLSVRQS